jgi:hypothetical protein
MSRYIIRSSNPTLLPPIISQPLYDIYHHLNLIPDLRKSTKLVSDLGQYEGYEGTPPDVTTIVNYSYINRPVETLPSLQQLAQEPHSFLVALVALEEHTTEALELINSSNYKTLIADRSPAGINVFIEFLALPEEGIRKIIRNAKYIIYREGMINVLLSDF